MNSFIHCDNPLYLLLNYIQIIGTAKDVIIHLLFLFSFKIDAVPGRINQLLTFVNRSGVFHGQCSELCGVNHAFMPIQLIALSSKNFAVN